MLIPEKPAKIISILHQHGFEVYAVGGCIRDTLLGKKPHDWDFCTNATPSEIQSCFSDFTTLDIGIKHGTITVILDHEPYEITTYRSEADYQDHRHPSSVQFGVTLEDDLSRRDFTINAMAYSPFRGLVDPFRGQEDLRQQIIRCVGNADQRFSEDALRILRAVRFSAQFGFLLHPDTLSAAIARAPDVRYISSERIFSEFTLFLQSPYTSRVVNQFTPLLNILFPPLQFESSSCRPALSDIFSFVPNKSDLALLYSVLFLCVLPDNNRVEAANDFLTKYRAPKMLLNDVSDLLSTFSPDPCPDKTAVLMLLRNLGADRCRMLLQLKECYALGIGQSPAPFRSDRRTLEHLLQDGACYQIKDLAVGGDDLLRLGFTGKEIGNTLNMLLDAVIHEQVQNRSDALLSFLKLHPFH